MCAWRAAWRAGKLGTAAEYETFLRAETQRCIARQEALGLDMLVHGELERSDMVEHVGQLRAGFAFNENGWEAELRLALRQATGAVRRRARSR